MAAANIDKRRAPGDIASSAAADKDIIGDTAEKLVKYGQ